MSRVDGLVLSGGHDIYPLLYGEEPCRQIGPVWPARDHFDMLLLQEAEKRGIPGYWYLPRYADYQYCAWRYAVSGFVQGCPSFVKHSQNQDPATPTHTIEIEPDSRLAKILGRTEWVTNTHHHQTVHEVGKGLVVTARAKDGTVESIQGTGENYLMGYQFHPEMMSINNELAKRLFKDFVQAAEAVIHGGR
jgi:putative glutamine amidotransferase